MQIALPKLPGRSVLNHGFIITADANKTWHVSAAEAVFREVLSSECVSENILRFVETRVNCYNKIPVIKGLIWEFRCGRCLVYSGEIFNRLLLFYKHSLICRERENNLHHMIGMRCLATAEGKQAPRNCTSGI